MCSTSVGYSCTTSTSFSMVLQKLRLYTSSNISTMEQRSYCWCLNAQCSCNGHFIPCTQKHEPCCNAPLVYPVIIKKLKCLFKEQRAFLWGGIIVAVIIIILIMCESVSVAQSMGEEQGRP